MGIDVVSNKEVLINHNHDRLVVTSYSKCPTFHDIGLDEQLTIIYQRKKNRKRSGDGNPLIYALKGMNGYSMPEEDQAWLFNQAKEIIENNFVEGGFDWIVPMPSSRDVVMRACETCSDALYVDVLDQVFSKSTNAYVLNQLQGIDESSVIKLRRRLERSPPNGVFTMKELTSEQRGHVDPIFLNEYKFRGDESLLLVDDLVSSGSTFISASKQLKEVYPDLNISYLSLLGPVI